jgi:hypothetical protein
MVMDNLSDARQNFLMQVIAEQADRIHQLERLQSYVQHRIHCEPSDRGDSCSCGLTALLKEATV